MSRHDSPRYPNMMRKVQRRRRLSAADEKTWLREPDEPGLSLSPAADACGFSNSLMLHARGADHGPVTPDATPSTASTPEFMDLRRLVKELQRRLRNEKLENEILKEAMDLARKSSNCCAHRHRR